MKLTPRQQAFLEKLFDLYREYGGAVHYSVVAERLNVNRFSAYDMLKLLEEKGVVASTYSLKEDNTGPGRSMVVFYPTREAIKFLPQLSQETQNGNEWVRLKENLLHRLQQTTENGYSKAVADMLNQISEIKSPLAYCTEMIGVLLLNLAQAKEKAGQIFPYKTLTNLTAEGQVGLGTLAGFSLSSLASSLGDESSDPTLRDKLMEHTREFQVKLTDMSEDSVKRLNLFLKDALKLFEQSLET